MARGKNSAGRLAGALIALALLTQGPRAHARFDYALTVDAPADLDCPAALQLQAAVEARAGSLVFLDDPEPARRIEVKLSRRGSAWQARLTLRDAQGAPLGERTLSSSEPACGALREALEIVIASWVGIADDGPPAAVTRGAVPLPLTAAESAARANASAAPLRLPHVERVDAAASDASADGGAGASFALELRAALGAESGVIPGFAWAAALAAGIELRPWRLQLGAALLPSAKSDLGAGASARFWAVAGEVSGCRDVFDAARAALSLCAALQAGTIAVATSGLEQSAHVHALRLAAALGPELRFAALARAGVFAALRASVPLVVERYYIVESASQRSYYHSVEWGAQALLGGYLHFGP